ncbi:hypothetical protein BH09ACT10_BH09ACT10_11050 [soil metagenome]
MTSTQPGGRRRLDASVTPAYDTPTRGPRLGSPTAQRWAVTAWFAVWVLSSLAAATAVVDVNAPSWIERPAAGIVMVAFAVGLTHRCGGRMRIWPVLAVAHALGATVLDHQGVIASAAVVTAVLGSVFALMVTRPAPSIPAAIREYALALIVALSGTVAVAAWNAPAEPARFNLVVLFLALGLIIGIVWSLGAGLHGLGREGLAVLIGGAVLLALILAYSSFVRAYGSDSLMSTLDDLIVWMRLNITGVPRPVEVFIGFPALIVGVSLRSRRREGWWVLVFAVVGTGVMTTSLVNPEARPTYIALSTLYSAILGLAVGLTARHFLVRDNKSRRSRAIEHVKRTEPPRISALN